MKTTKWIFIANCFLFASGLFRDDDLRTGVSIIIFVILAVTAEILEAINDKKEA